jgi:hypothetical protein
VSKVIEPQPWRTTFIFSLATTIISYTLFRALEVNFPKGILGL